MDKVFYPQRALFRQPLGLRLTRWDMRLAACREVNEALQPLTGQMR